MEELRCTASATLVVSLNEDDGYKKREKMNLNCCVGQ
jgi:hypothetical protein